MQELSYLTSHYGVKITGAGTSATLTVTNHQYLQPSRSTKVRANSAASNTTAINTTNFIRTSLSKLPHLSNYSHKVSLLSFSIRIGKSTSS
ncbi:MAG TPA: hypothetical protein VFI73_00750 [Candidatus Nitrosopolaris sp.]|nr:hypothetical protein [Candidatus Nitrosopolaris sp.]